MTVFSPRKKAALAYDRETQLRMEIVAAMRLRALWRNVARRQLASHGLPAGDLQSTDDKRLHHHSPHSVGSGGDPGEHTTRILLISDYDGLRTSCERLLRKHGYQVNSMNSRHCLGTEDLPRFDIAVLCQSVECDHVPMLSASLRSRNPTCCLLRVASLLSGIESGFDLRVDGFGGPAAFLAALDSLVHSPRKPA